MACSCECDSSDYDPLEHQMQHLGAYVTTSAVNRDERNVNDSRVETEQKGGAE